MADDDINMYIILSHCVLLCFAVWCYIRINICERQIMNLNDKIHNKQSRKKMYFITKIDFVPFIKCTYVHTYSCMYTTQHINENWSNRTKMMIKLLKTI